MSILYSQINDKKLYLLESSYSKIGEQIRSNTQILKELRDFIKIVPSNDTNIITKEQDSYVYYVLNVNDKILSAITDDVTPEKVVGAYFLEIKDNDNLKDIMDKYNTEYTPEEISQELLKARNICVKSLESVINRGEKVSKLNSLADELSYKVKRFQKESKNAFKEDNVKNMIFIGIIFL
ncbi:Synaptobrevin complex, partial [Spraguea lophii 42_110]